MAAVTICSDLEPKKIKSVIVSNVSPSICHEVMGLDAMIYTIWMLSFKPVFFTLLFSLSSRGSLVLCFLPYGWCHLHIWDYWYLSEILIPACAISSLTFCKMYSSYKLNKKGGNIQPWYTPFLIWNQSVVPCPVLTVASWPAHRFLRRRVKCFGIPTSLRIFHSLFWSIQSKALA